MSNKYNKFLLIFLLILVAIMIILSPERFLSARNIRTLMRQLPEVGLISLGMTVVILTGGIDLSITAASALSGILGAMFLTSGVVGGQNLIIIIIGTVFVILAAGVIAGMINGVFVSYVGVTSILVTIGTRTLFQGISLSLTRGGSISGFPREFYWFGQSFTAGIPTPMFIFIVISITLYILIEKTPWGKKVYHIGSNMKAAKFNGIKVKRILFQVYLLASTLAAVAGLLMISRYNTARVDLGDAYLLRSVAATVLGGNSITGGEGNIMGTILAVVILQVLGNGMNILGVHSFVINITMGAILIMVLAANYLIDKKQIGTKESKVSA